MKYGKTERICGIVILLALAAIIVPWLMSEPAPRDEPLKPSFDVEKPVDVPRHEVPAPQKPDSIDADKGDEGSVANAVPLDSATGEADDKTPEAGEKAVAEPPTLTAEEPGDDDAPAAADRAESGDDKSDPIADMMQGSDAPKAAEGGEWAVQVGSFGQAENASRLKKELEGQGFRVYTRARDNDLTTVLVGPYSSSDDGEQARSLIKEKANQQGLLVRVRD
ncbi:SPOR domain-containing protein [Halomonas piscis]|uniref:SPOR domain-containing protein n=1 Tax=Halomonas piscis TaxID=3031727 RepID=A0ABY9YW55_9GAMM|nr:SPOR domain-containing protein [Halomonas piscis]WNK19098.1 SPOR domain-containing protein [Halomonas piscis]